MKIKAIHLAIAALILSVACANNNPPNQSATLKKDEVVSPLLSSVGKEVEFYTINTKKDTVITSVEGSTIAIPAGSLLDKNGVAIDGKVEVTFSEFHTVEDLLLSGIPMEYDENGEEGYLITAGMCSISATYKGEEVQINESNPLKVELASKYTGNGEVGFFTLDEATGTWTRGNEATSIENPARQEMAAQIKILNDQPEPITPRKLDPNEPVLNFNETGSISTVGLNFAVWRFAGNKKKNNPLYREEFRSNSYRLMRTRRLANESGLIRAYFKLGYPDKEKREFVVTDTLSIRMLPVLFGDALKKAQEAYSTAMTNYKERLAEKARLEARYDATAPFRYGFSINGWGTFNCDVFSRNTSVKYALRLEENGFPIDDAKVSLLMTNNQESGVVNQPYKYGRPYKLFTNGTCHLVVGIDNEVAIIRDIRNNELVKSTGNSLVITVNDFKRVETTDDLSEMLAKL